MTNNKLTGGPLFAEVHNVPDDYHFTDVELDRIIAGDMFTPRQGAIMARELLERRKADEQDNSAFAGMVEDYETKLAELRTKLQERRNTDSAYPVAWTAKDVRNSQLATRVGIYERIYGLLRECPGPNSIYSVAPSGNEHVPHGICAHVGCISFYCNFGHLHLGEPDASQGRHTHSLSGGKNDA